MSQVTAHNTDDEDSFDSDVHDGSDPADDADSIAHRLSRCASSAADTLTDARFSQLDPLVRQILRSIRRAVNAIDVHVYLVRIDDARSGPVSLMYRSGRSTVRPELGLADRFQFQLFSEPVQSALLQEQIVRVRSDVAAGGRIVQGVIQQLNCDSYFLCPLFSGGSLRGILGVAFGAGVFEEPSAEFRRLLRLNGAVLLNNIRRIRRERRRRRDLRRWRRIADQACDFAICIDDRFVVCRTTPFGLAKATPEFEGLRLTDIVARNFHREVKKQIQTAVKTTSVRTISFQVMLGHEGPQWYLARIEPSGNTRSAFATLYFTDNSPDKVLEEKNRELTGQLIKASRLSLLGQMSTEFAHQLNQPLQAIMNYCNTLQKRIERGTATDENMLTSIANIEMSVQHSADIIDRIREFVKFRTLQIEEVTLKDILDHANIMVQPTARGWNADLIPPTAVPDINVAVDKAQTIHVFVNLMINALEACCEFCVDRPKVELYVRERSDDGSVVVAVKDNGPGLPAGDPDVVFEKFYTGKKDGIGMGLAISRDVCVSQGGALSARNNTDGDGCTFFVRMRLQNDTGSDTAELETLPESDLPID